MILALILALAFVSPAQAHWTPPPTTEGGKLAVYQPLAEAAWPDSPCEGRTTVSLKADDYLNNWPTTTFIKPDGVGFSDQFIDACHVYIRGGLDPEWFCTVLVHEYGHLDHQVHNDIKGNIMNGSGHIFWQRCHDLVAPEHDPYYLVSRRLPGRLKNWHVVCNRRNCRAEARGRTTLRFRIHRRDGRVYKVTQIL